MSLNESIVEDAALEWFGDPGDTVGHGPHPAPGEPAAEREREPERSGDGWSPSFSEGELVGRWRGAIRRLNPVIPGEARPTIKHYLQVRLERRLSP